VFCVGSGFGRLEVSPAWLRGASHEEGGKPSEKKRNRGRRGLRLAVAAAGPFSVGEKP